MTEPKTVEPIAKASDCVNVDAVGSSPTGGTSTDSQNKPVKELSPEEQMALYENELKENDWGHQPC